MVLRHVTVELTEKQYETLCRMTANAGMPVADVIQAFAEELPGNSALDGWLKQHQRKNFLSYLAQKEKLDFVASLFQKVIVYQANISAAYAKRKEKEAAKKEEPKKEEKVEEVTIDDFAKLQFKVGTILKCEPHPKADRLLVEQVDLGGEVRQIVSGIAKHYKPEELIGKQVVVVTNLKPVKLRGVESYGMILCATDDKDLSFVTVAKEMPNGVTVR